MSGGIFRIMRRLKKRFLSDANDFLSDACAICSFAKRDTIVKIIRGPLPFHFNINCTQNKKERKKNARKVGNEEICLHCGA